jgi:hypothetical protein
MPTESGSETEAVRETDPALRQEGTATPAVSGRILGLPLFIVLLLFLMVLALGGLLVLILYRLRNSPRRYISRASRQRLSYREEDTEGALMLSLFVEDQNTAIGRRNIHAARSGSTFTLGGGKSDFLVFLVPFPPNIAEVHYDGNECMFIPKRPEFFPELGSKTLANCIGKEIHLVSERKYKITIKIGVYEDPLESLHRLLHSVRVPHP